MKLIIGVKNHFDASHFLEFHKGKCQNLHGHTWHLEVEMIGDVDENGFVLDLHELKQAVKDVCDQFDHKNVNAVITDSPTCENLIHHIHTMLSKHSIICQAQLSNISIYRIRLQEGEGGWAEWRSVV